MTLDGETPVTAKLKTGFCWETLLSAIPAHPVNGGRTARESISRHASKIRTCNQLLTVEGEELVCWYTPNGDIQVRVLAGVAAGSGPEHVDLSAADGLQVLYRSVEMPMNGCSFATLAHTFSIADSGRHRHHGGRSQIASRQEGWQIASYLPLAPPKLGTLTSF